MKEIPTPDSLRPGDLVGPWRVEGYAGLGTYSVVYRARRAEHPGSVPVALKMDVPVQEEVRVSEPEPSGYSVMLPSGLAAAAVVLLAAGILWLSSEPREEAPELARAEARDDRGAPDAGTSGLGDSTLTTRVASEVPPVAREAKVVARELPDDPLPGQRRAPCKGHEQEEINGGCWLMVNTQPPCGEDAYEWKGTCYYPIFIVDRVKPRTSKKPR